jgi:hypothetical protein
MTATEMHQVCGTSDDVSDDPTPVLEHRANCLCNAASKRRPAEMWDERRVASVPLLSSSLLKLLDKALAEDGTPMVRTYTSRWNAAGEGIGPDMQIRSCDALLFWRVQNRVFRVIELGAERQR